MEQGHELGISHGLASSLHVNVTPNTGVTGTHTAHTVQLYNTSFMSNTHINESYLGNESIQSSIGDGPKLGRTLFGLMDALYEANQNTLM